MHEKNFTNFFTFIHFLRLKKQGICDDETDFLKVNKQPWQLATYAGIENKIFEIVGAFSHLFKGVTP